MPDGRKAGGDGAMTSQRVRSICAVMRKDIAAFAPLIGIAAAALVAEVVSSAIHFPVGAAVTDVAALTVALLMVAVVGEDRAASAGRDVLVRPVRRLDLITAKSLFMLLFGVLPLSLASAAAGFAEGLPVAVAMSAGLGVGLSALIVAPLLIACAATATGMLRAILLFCVVLAMVYLLFAGPRAANLYGARPAVDWVLVAPAAITLTVVSAAALWLAYGRRSARTAVIVLLGGVAATWVLAAAIPNSALFALQRRFIGTSAAADGVKLVLVPQRFVEAPILPLPKVSSLAALPAYATLGDQSGWPDHDCNGLTFWSDRLRSSHSVGIRSSAAVQGLPAGDRLIVDDVEAAYVDAQGSVIAPLVKGVHAGEEFGPASRFPLLIENGWLAPGPMAARRQQARLRLDYELTVLEPTKTHKLWPLGSRLQGLGYCDVERGGSPDQWVITCLHDSRAPVAMLTAYTDQKDFVGDPSGHLNGAHEMYVSGYFHSPPVFGPRWLSASGGESRIYVNLNPTQPVPVMTLTSYRVAGHVHRRLYAKPDIFEGSKIACDRAAAKS